MSAKASASGLRMSRSLRIAWAAGSALIVESALLGIAALPALLLLQWLAHATAGPARAVVLLFSLGPAYVIFCIALMVASALTMRALGWRTPRDASVRIADMQWPLLDWARYLTSSHVVRLLAGSLLRATPLWTMYVRLNGARAGHRVYINSPFVMDHNLLELGDDVVIGSDAHVSGHTVEGGFVKTGAVRLGRDVTIGVGSVIGIDVTIGAGTQIAALSLVPKHARLPQDARYVGIPVQRVDGYRDRQPASVLQASSAS